jgi:hypothetical protein
VVCRQLLFRSTFFHLSICHHTAYLILHSTAAHQRHDPYGLVEARFLACRFHTVFIFSLWFCSMMVPFTHHETCRWCRTTGTLYET